MILPEKLEKDKTYKTPESQHQFQLIGKFDLDFLCFRRVSDGALYYGSELTGSYDGVLFLDLEEV